MPSPAELLSMQHAPQAVESPSSPISEPESLQSSASVVDQSTESTDSTADESIAEEPVKVSKRIDLNDDKLFPSLGSAVAPTSAWASAASSWSKPAIKPSSMELTFIIDDEQQQNLATGELLKIFANIKSQFNVKVESTHSPASRKRTFLLNGARDMVPQAKRELIKKLTKPTKLVFEVPSKLRSVIIGPMGKNLKPIIAQTSVRIDISKQSDDSSNELLTEDEELFGKSILVTVEGDIQGCTDAKNKILQIVNENTKDLIVKVQVSEKVKPFIKSAISKLSVPKSVEIITPEPSSRISTILISGPKDDVVSIRYEIKSILATLENDVVIDEREVPKHLHAFLDSDKIFNETDVIIEVPDIDSANSKVRFIGLKNNISKAIPLAKDLTSKYFVETLDLSKSHGGNYLHAKNLTAYLTYNKFLEELSSNHGINVSGPSYQNLADSDVKNVVISFSSSLDNKDAIKKARRDLIDTVNKITPSFVRTINDIESFVLPKLDSTVAFENDVAIVQLGNLANSGNALLLIATQSDDEFLPSAEQIKERLDTVDKSLDTLRELNKELTSVVINVSPEDQSKLDEGNTLKVLLNKYESNTIEIKLHQNAEGASDNEIYLIGYTNAINKAVDDIKKVIDDIKNYEEASKYNTTIEFPVKNLARLIGQKGSFVNELMEQFNIRIDATNDDSSSSENAQIKLTGLQSNVDECIKKINALSKTWSDEKTVTINVDQNYRRQLIGHNGVYANRLQDKYNVKLQFSDSNEKDGKVTIRGPSRGVAKVEEEIKQLLAYEKEHGFVETISISAEALPIVIGKGGENINDISAECEVRIRNKFNQEENKKNGSETVFEIIGSKSGIKEAKGKIEEICKRIANHAADSVDVDPKWFRNLIGPNGMTSREIITGAGASTDDRNFRRYLQLPQRGSDSNTIRVEGNKIIVAKVISKINELVKEYESVTSQTIEVPKKQHRLIIGFSNSTRKSIEEEFKVRVIVPAQAVESDTITITGKVENIEKAIVKIQELTQPKK